MTHDSGGAQKRITATGVGRISSTILLLTVSKALPDLGRSERNGKILTANIYQRKSAISESWITISLYYIGAMNDK